MNQLNLKLSGTILFSLLSISIFAQNWKVDGNTNAQLGGSLTPSLGTDQNRPLLFETNGIQRMFLNSGNGFIGMGNNFSNPTYLLNLRGFGNNTGEMFRTVGNFGLENIWSLRTGLGF